jgi:hypothetical protein
LFHDDKKQICLTLAGITRYMKGIDRLCTEGYMSLQAIKDAIAQKKLLCPLCKSPVQQFSNYAETIDAVRDGFNIQEIESNGERVTLTCGNAGCDWKERTEYPMEYVIE